MEMPTLFRSLLATHVKNCQNLSNSQVIRPDRLKASQNKLTKSRHISRINLENFGCMTCIRTSYVPTVPTTTVFHSKVSSFIICAYCTHLSSYCTTHTYLVCHLPGLPDARRIPKVSSFVPRSESIQIKPLQRLPTVCAINLTRKGRTPLQTNIAPTAYAACHSGQFR